MKLQEVFDQLSAGEFAQLTIAGQEPGVINENNYKVVLSHVNLALSALFRRFHLKEGRVVVAIQPGMLTYLLKSDYATTNTRSQQPVKYLLDAAGAPFKDDIMKVTRVLTNRDLELPLNDVGDRWSCFTPNMLTLVVPDEVANPTSETPKWLKTDTLTVVYRANHPVLTVPIGYFDPNRVQLELPPMYMEALLYHIASRVSTPIGMAQEGMAGNNYYTKYESVCRQLDALNLEVDQGAMENRLRNKGWA